MRQNNVDLCKGKKQTVKQTTSSVMTEKIQVTFVTLGNT